MKVAEIPLEIERSRQRHDFQMQRAHLWAQAYRLAWEITHLPDESATSADVALKRFDRTVR